MKLRFLTIISLSVLLFANQSFASLSFGSSTDASETEPNKSFSGRGISIVNKEGELAEAIMIAKAISEDLEYSIEEYVEGTLHSVSLFVDDHNIVDYFFVDEFCQTYEYAVDNSNFPSTLTKEVQNEVLETMKSIISKMRLTRGLLHTQFIKNDAGHKIIEMMRRCPGDLYGRLMELSENYQYHKNYLMIPEDL